MNYFQWLWSRYYRFWVSTSKVQHSQWIGMRWYFKVPFYFFPSFLFFATLPHYISLVRACPSVGIQFPAHSPLPIYSSRGSDLSPHSKRQWSPPWRMCSQSYWLPLFLAHQCALSQLWLASSAKNLSSEGVGTPRLRQRLRLSNIDWVFIFVFPLLVKLCRIPYWVHLEFSSQQIQWSYK